MALPSFDVWDLDTVDRQVQRMLFTELKSPSNWDVMIAHFLGVDHVGHKYGPNQPQMGRKLREVNQECGQEPVPGHHPPGVRGQWDD